MMELNLREPKEIEIAGKKFIISKFPYFAGREIVTQYLPTGLPKLGDYKSNENLARKLMNFVAVSLGDSGKYTRLNNDGLIENHIPSITAGLKLEWAVIEYNVDFFQDGQASSFLSNILRTARQWIIEISTTLLAPSSTKDVPPSES